MVGRSFEGPAESLKGISINVNHPTNVTYPGLDITAGVFPFFLREKGPAGGAGVSWSGSVSCTFWRLERLEEVDFAGSESAVGLVFAGAFRFLVDPGVRVGGAGVEAAADVLGDVSEESAACLAAAALVILLLRGMST